jgi:hypothetical protein
MHNAGHNAGRGGGNSNFSSVCVGGGRIVAKCIASSPGPFQDFQVASWEWAIASYSGRVCSQISWKDTSR